MTMTMTDASARGEADGAALNGGAAVRSAVGIGDGRRLGEGAYSVTIFANEMSRDGVTVELDGMDFSNYEKNPVVLYAHDYMGRTESGGLPIGRTTRLSRTAEGHIRADFEFLSGDAFAERVRNAWERGFLRGASIGWRAVESRPEGRRIRAVRSELLEWSIVAVPADPDALRDAYRRMAAALIEGEADAAGAERAERVIFDHRAGEVEAGGEDLSETRRLLDEVFRSLGIGEDGDARDES